jgi:hypothetical protein
MKNTAIVLLFLASLATPTFAAGTDMHEFASKHAFAQEQPTQINPIKERPIGSAFSRYSYFGRGRRDQEGPVAA